jgi:hypothetical protein
MPPDSQNPLSFLSGFVQSRGIVRAIATIDELTEKGSSRTWLMKWTKSDGRWGRFVVPWSATRMWVINQGGAYVFATGPEGKVAILTPTGSREESIDPTADGPISRGPIRDLHGIGGALYACGMGRQVYRRTGDGLWQRADTGAVLPRGVARVAGFNSIDGTSEDDIFAVGFLGEIWRYEVNSWRQLDSPTNAILYGVKVVGKSEAFACGQNGVLLRGRGDVWEAIDHQSTEDDFWDLEWFRDRLYVASDDAIYRLDQNDVLTELAFDEVYTFGDLHANDGVLWSFGTKDLIWTEDGVQWNDATP